ncbi:unnamed protein product [Angiostrongylus costaricensis]|uniref:G_PROTEIN_RECEP_F1_2 domain-containing protein n=1 Tax=Angiostrongylus costaricensis TaxID=334426 RepID=A0A0R3PPA0_ANGCS|nr:unnamed protein product [Angiostrongylus costaricensis]
MTNLLFRRACSQSHNGNGDAGANDGDDDEDSDHDDDENETAICLEQQRRHQGRQPSAIVALIGLSFSHSLITVSLALPLYCKNNGAKRITQAHSHRILRENAKRTDEKRDDDDDDDGDDNNRTACPRRHLQQPAAKDYCPVSEYERSGTTIQLVIPMFQNGSPLPLCCSFVT